MESIKERIFKNNELFEITFGDDTTTHRVLMGAQHKEVLFFVERDKNSLVFCRAKLSDEITKEDFFSFNENTFDNLIVMGKVRMF